MGTFVGADMGSIPGFFSKTENKIHGTKVYLIYLNIAKLGQLGKI